jgi:molecular chaperone GrpE
LPILDDFDRLFQNTNEHENSGTKLIYSKLISTLTDEGLEPIKCIGEDFNPELHEAVLTNNKPEQKNNTILDEIQKGYLFKSKLLRPAKVSVVRNESNENENNEPVNLKSETE